MESIISTFHIDWKIILAQAVNFGIVLLVFYLFAYKPLRKLMQNRSDRIAGGVLDAKRNAELLAQTKKEYDDMLAQARTEAQKIFESSKREAENKRAEMIENAKKEVSGIIEKGRETLENDKRTLVSEARREIVDLTVTFTEKVLGEKPARGYDEKAIKELLGA